MLTLENNMVMTPSLKGELISSIQYFTPALKGEAMGFSRMLKSSLGDLGVFKEME
jgi:hypothetical protein